MEPEQNLSIQLSGLRFFGHYGLYPVESKWTTELIVDLAIHMKLQAIDSIHLKDTIDYTAIYKTVAFEMKSDHQLLESIAVNLIKCIKAMDQRIMRCKVRVTKKPQLGGPFDQIAVELEY